VKLDLLPEWPGDIEEADQSLWLATSEGDQVVCEEISVVDQAHLSWFKILSRYAGVQLFV